MTAQKGSTYALCLDYSHNGNANDIQLQVVARSTSEFYSVLKKGASTLNYATAGSYTVGDVPNAEDSTQWFWSKLDQQEGVVVQSRWDLGYMKKTAAGGNSALYGMVVNPRSGGTGYCSVVQIYAENPGINLSANLTQFKPITTQSTNVRLYSYGGSGTTFAVSTDGSTYTAYANGSTVQVTSSFYLRVFGNFTAVMADSVVDNVPPSITNYSAQGASCTNWNLNGSSPCTTVQTTPNIYFNTSEAANCAIGRTNVNYSAMGSARNCTYGEGAIEHLCTLIEDDILMYEDSLVYLSCKDSSGNQGNASTSGPLALTVTGLEAAGDRDIGIGVQNALLSNYTNYTSQQISARNFNGDQDSGRFDWVAKKGNKVWAFNYVTKGEEHVGMFNMTPALYVFEMSNITSTNITKFAETVINSTK